MVRGLYLDYPDSPEAYSFGHEYMYGDQMLVAPVTTPGKGEVVTVDRAGALSTALAARASQAGMWCGVAGIPEFGVAAAAEMGADPARVILVPEPGAKWAEAAAAPAARRPQAAPAAGLPASG